MIFPFAPANYLVLVTVQYDYIDSTLRTYALDITPQRGFVVGVTSEQGLAVRTPCQADTLWLSALLANLHELGLQLVNLALLLQIEDDDAAGGGSAEPVAVGGEDKGVDLVTGVQGVEVLGLVQVPEHGGSVLSTGGAERAVGGDGDGVDVAGVADVVGLRSAGSELPNLLINVSGCSACNESGKQIEYAKIVRISALVNGCLMALDAGSEVANTLNCIASYRIAQAAIVQGKLRSP